MLGLTIRLPVAIGVHLHPRADTGDGSLTTDERPHIGHKSRYILGVETANNPNTITYLHFL
jgi:hypothetical protein